MKLNKTKHRTILFQILKNIYQDTELAPILGFKGGTAAAFFYGLSRFSVDLDFDLLDPTQEDLVFRRIAEIAKQYGVIKDHHKKRFNLICVMSYEETAHKVKLEVNRRKDNSQFELKQYMGLPVLVMKKDDMFANKIMAMYERMNKTSRDIYDVWYFLNNRWELNEKLISERMKLQMADFSRECLEKIEKFDNKKILNGLGDLLDEPQKDWVRAKLKSELTMLMRFWAEQIRKI